MRNPILVARCSCGCAYTADQWNALPLVGDQPDGEGGVLELRNCTCTSTIAAQVQGLDTNTDTRFFWELDSP